MDSKEKSRQKKHVTLRIAICVLILVIGWAAMNGLASLKQPPAEAKTEERPIKVQTTTVQPKDYPVVITGFGEAVSLTVVTVAPEVSGRVVYTHPTLKTGQRIPVGDVMFRIDTEVVRLVNERARVAAERPGYCGRLIRPVD